MRIFKPKYEKIWNYGINEYCNWPEYEKDWDKIDIMTDSEVNEQYKKSKSKCREMEKMLETVTDEYETKYKHVSESSDVVHGMIELMNALKLQYFFVHSLQEIISIRKILRVQPKI